MAKRSDNWRNRIIGYDMVEADQLLTNPSNWRGHPHTQQEALEGILDQVGWVQEIIVNKMTGHVVDGHLRVLTALSHNEKVPVKYVELTEDEERLILATIDPISAMAFTDAEKLDELLQTVNSDSAAVQAMLTQLAESAGLYLDENNPVSSGDANALMDRAEELKRKYNVERGQLWVIGRHRLMCGDSYNQDHIDRLMDGQTPDMLHTDPPYGISIVKPKVNGSAAAIGGAKSFGSTGEANRKGKTAVAFRDSGKVGGGRGDLLRHPDRRDDVGRVGRGNIIQSNIYPVIEGDDRPFDPSQFLDFAPVVIMWGANYYADKLPPKACWITWDKREDITRNNFADCELAWTNQDSPARCFHHLWNGLHKGSQNGERRIHPTEKPVALFAEIGRMYAPEGLWVDLFAGSGSQIVAAEQTGATCYALEYEPLYVACVIQRLADMGLQPRLSE